MGSCLSKLVSNGCCVWKGAQLPLVHPGPGKLSLRRAREIRHEGANSVTQGDGGDGAGHYLAQQPQPPWATQPVSFCTPSPHVHRSMSTPLPGLYFRSHPLKALWQGSLRLLAVCLGHLLPFPCLGKRVGEKKG